MIFNFIPHYSSQNFQINNNRYCFCSLITCISENKIIEQSVIRIDIQDVLPSRTVFTKTVLGITPEFGSIPGGHT